MMNTIQSPWLTPTEAAQYLKTSRNFLDRDRLERRHQIPFFRLGRHIRYRQSDLDNFVESTVSGR